MGCRGPRFSVCGSTIASPLARADALAAKTFVALVLAVSNDSNVARTPRRYQGLPHSDFGVHLSFWRSVACGKCHGVNRLMIETLVD